LEGLSNREFQVIRLIGSGQSTREVAESLGISVKTVETYINHLKEKLGIHSGVALTHKAIQWMERGVLQ
jgi:DNA-binding CsgD family transcriptional regulator